jgi:hypothetical protein
LSPAKRDGFISKLKKYFIMDMKNNRKCMFATQEKNKEMAWSKLGDFKNYQYA